MPNWALAGLAGLMALALGACVRSEAPAGNAPAILRVSVLPDDRPAELQARHGALVRYLAEQTGAQFELVIPRTYQQFLESANQGEYHLAYFGGFTFVVAHERAGILPLVMRDVDARFTSYLLVRNGHPANSLADLRGTRFSFGSRLSTSGHLMPRYFMREMGITPESYFSALQYSGSHDRTVDLVVSGAVDAGVANSSVVDRMLREGRLQRTDLRIVWRTPPYVDYVWATSPSLPAETREALMQAFLRLTKAEPDDRSLLDAQSADVFLPASLDDFSQLQKIVQDLDLGSGSRQD